VALLQEDSPICFELGKFGSTDSAWEQLGSGRLQPRLGRDLALIELFQALTPPGELDRRKRGLARSGDDIRHRFIDVEQGIECGPQLGRPVEPDEIAIAQLSDK
jgi:hypothetical protein